MLVAKEQLDVAYRDYRHTVNIYKENAGNPDDFDLTHTTVPSKPPNNGSWVVFYTLLMAAEGSDQEDILYLSPAQITRTVFCNRVNDLLGSHASCQDPSDLCESCLLFGMMGEDGQASSRLRFSDATMTLGDGEEYDDRLIPSVTLRELSSPKPSSLEFYTMRPETKSGDKARIWTYDGATFGYTGAGRNVRPISERFALGMPTIVRGRKFYLHHYVADENADDAILLSCQPEERGEAGKTKRNMTTEVVRAGTVFRFRVFFERLEEEQLQKLVWTMCLGENDVHGEQLHMFGHAKPLGLGSAKVCVQRVLLWGDHGGYSLDSWDVDAGLAKASFVDSNVVSDVLTITNYTLTQGLTVSYPRADDMGSKKNSRASHQWFVANRELGEGGTSFTPSVYRTLPTLPSGPNGRAVLVLPKYTKNSRQRIHYASELGEEPTVVPREQGVIKSIKPSRNPNEYWGWIAWGKPRDLYFHTSRSPMLDLVATPLANGTRVSFTVGKNVGGKNPNQDCAYDIRVEG